MSWFSVEADPEDPSWQIWRINDEGRFNLLLGDLRARRDGKNAVVRMIPGRQLSNIYDGVHGGALMGLIDSALYMGVHTLGSDLNCVTLDCSVQFLAAAAVGRPVDAVIEIIRETRLLIFVRGLVEQEGEAVASFTGILRKTGK